MFRAENKLEIIENGLSKKWNFLFFFKVVERDVSSVCVVATFGRSILNKYSLLFSFVFSGIRHSWSVNTLAIEGNRNIIAKYYGKEYCLKFFRTNVIDWQASVNPLNAELNPICHLLVLLGDLIFMVPCIVSVFQYISNKMQRYTVYLYLETAVHVSGGTSTHHQEPIQLYLQHLVFVTPLLLPAAIAARSSNGLTNTRCCRYICICSWW